MDFWNAVDSEKGLYWNEIFCNSILGRVNINDKSTQASSRHNMYPFASSQDMHISISFQMVNTL